MPSSMTHAMLDALRQALKVSIEVARTGPNEDQVWRVVAVDSNGQQWSATHEDDYQAAVLLAELVGFELEE